MGNDIKKETPSVAKADGIKRQKYNSNTFLGNTWKHKAHVVMCLPAFIILFLFAYMPIFGLVGAFKEFSPQKGLFLSPWVGLENFKFLIASGDIFKRMTFNTLKFYLIFTILGTFLNIVLAIAIDQCVFKRASKIMQSVMIVPVFVSYAAVTFIVSAFLSNAGIINNIIAAAGGERIAWYTSPEKWTAVLTIVKIWNSVGYGSVLYMSVLSGIDTELYEAAQIDGAGKWRQIIHITIPSLIPMITVMLLLSVGGIMRSDTGLFYQVTRNTGGLYATTQVIDSYVLNSIKSAGKVGYTMAASFFQSVVGLILILIANYTVKKISPEDSLF